MDGTAVNNAAEVTPKATPPRLLTDSIPFFRTSFGEFASELISPGPAYSLI
jgi:hypothetical protein